MKNEIWKTVEGHQGRYQVSNMGRLRSVLDIEQPLILSDNSDNGNGYIINMVVVDEGISKTRYRHRLVAETFLPNPENLPQVGHKDDDKSNNAVDNLYWCEGSTNIQDAHKTGRMKKRKEHGSTCRYEDDITEMAYRSVKMGYFGVSEAAKFFDMPRTTLSSIMNKRSRSSITDPIDLEFAQ